MKQLSFEGEKLSNNVNNAEEELDANALPIPANPQPCRQQFNSKQTSSKYSDEDAAVVAELHKNEDNKVVGTKIDESYEKIIEHIDKKAKITKNMNLLVKGCISTPLMALNI